MLNLSSSICRKEKAEPADPDQRRLSAQSMRKVIYSWSPLARRV